jgi:carbon-monoxide dehydrogenase large subunit
LATEVEVATKAAESVVGKPLRRMEDPRFITGSARFMDGIALPNMLHASFVRSTYAHAKITNIDSSLAMKHPSARLVLTARTLADEVEAMPTVEWDEDAKATHRYPLALDEANFEGECLAMVVTEDAPSAQEVAELVQVDYDPLPVVVDPEEALKEGSPLVHSYLQSNQAYYTVRSSGNIKKAFREADHIVKASFRFPRLNAVPMETRGIVASYDPAEGRLTVYVSSQSPHEIRGELAKILKLPEDNVRVIVPDMGGAFGQKEFYPEYPVVCIASMKLGRPVRWSESRMENLMAATQGRGQVQHVEAAVRKDGKILGLKVKVICDGGAYSFWSISMPELTVQMSPGAYDIEAFHGEAITAFTNKTPIGAYRGASRPEATYLIERTVDEIASQLKLDPVRVRLRNFVPKESFPYKSPGGLTYDSGDYAGNLKQALALSKFEELRKYQRDARSHGRLVGIGLITYVEVCGFGPEEPQTASVTVTRSGRVIIDSGTIPHGQGHRTSFAQIVSDELGIDVKDIAVRHGDTSFLPWSTVTAGSRSAVVGGTAVLLATRKVKAKMTTIATKMLGSRAERLVFRGGKVFPEGSPSKGVTFADVADMAYQPEELPRGMEPTLYEYSAYAPPENVVPFGTHVAMVEVDGETGKVKILKYVAVDDVGRVLNSLIVEGQVQGGVLQGISQALFEQIVYDDSGTLTTATFSDYLIPSSDSSPTIECYRTETPSPLNPLGLKGAGEVGTIAATPAIVNAVQDAISPFNKTIEELPLSPSYIWSMTRDEKDCRRG